MMIRNARRPLHQLLLAFVTGFTTVAVALPASSSVWSFVGARYQAMGGAGVAVVDDSLAQYWNPGALGFMTGYDAQLPISANYSIENRALESLTSLIDATGNIKDVLEAIGDPGGGGITTPEDFVAVLGIINELSKIGLEGQSVQGNLDVGLIGHVNRIGFGVLSLTSANIQPIFDVSGGLSLGAAVPGAVETACAAACMTPANTALAAMIASDNMGTWDTVVGGATTADQLVYYAETAGVDTFDPDNAAILSRIAADTASAGSTTIANNSAIGTDIQGLSTQEFGISYGYPIPMPFFEPLDRKIAVGVVLKYMLGISYSTLVSYRDSTDVGDLISDAFNFDNIKTSHAFGLDLGLLAKPYDWLRVGLVARNVNGPTFDRSTDLPGQKSEFELEPQVRMGVAVIPFKNWIIAADIDLTENASLEVPSFRSRIFSLGTEYTLPVSWASLAFRVGGHLNTANLQNNDFAITGGLGMRFGNFVLDLGIGTSFKLEEFSTGSDSTASLPTRLNAGINLSWRSRPEGTRRHTGKFTTP